MTCARDFTSRLATLLSNEHAALAEFLVVLADFDRRRLWLDLGYGSIFDFLHRELGLSKASASFRKRAAELVQSFPEIVGPLRDGRLCLTSVFELGKVLTPENRDEVLPRFFQLGKREAKAMAAALAPHEAPRREVVTSVRASPPSPPSEASPALREGAAEPAFGSRAAAEPSATSGSLTVVRPAEPVHANFTLPPQQGPAPAPRPGAARAPAPTSADPLTADLSRLHVTVSRRFLAKLEAARAALSHSHPCASADEILEAGLDLLLERHAKRKGLVKKPRATPPPATPEHVPAHVKRAVWRRDGGRCQWVLDGGGVCGSDHRVELDHVLPRGRGGPPTIDNLRLLCRVHNEYAARQVYGDAWMDRFTGGRRPPAPGRGEPTLSAP